MATKSAAQLATEAKMRAQAKLKNGGKSDAQMATEAKMRNQAISRASQPKIDPKAAELARVRDYYAKNGHIPTMLANDSKRLFGDASSVDVGELGRKVALGQITLAQAQAAIKSGTAGLDPEAKRAGLAASIEIDPQITAIQTQKRLGQEGFDRANSEAQAQNRRTVAEQQELYRRLQQSLEGRRGEFNEVYDQGEAGVKGAYAALQQALDSNYNGAIQSTNDFAARLGQQAALPVATQEMTADQQYLKGVAGVQQAGALGTLGAERTADQSDLIAALMQASTEGTSLSGNTLRDFAKQSAAERFAQQQQIEEMDSAATALEATRTGRVFEGRNALEDAQAQQVYQAQQDAFANAIAQQKANAQTALAGVQGYEAETERQYKQGMLGVAQADSMTKAEIGRATINKTNAEKEKILATMTPGTPAYNALAADIALKNAQAAKAVTDAAATTKNANTNASKAASNYGKGLAGANKYLSATLGGQGGVATGQLVNQAYNKYPPSSDKKKNDENFKKALSQARAVIQKQTRDQRFHNAVDAAIAIAYGR